MKLHRPSRLCVAVLFCAVVLPALPAAANETLAQLEARVPTEPLDFTAAATAQVATLAEQVEAIEYQNSLYPVDATAEQILEVVENLVDAKARVDRLLRRTVEVRGRFVEEQDEEVRRTAAREFLVTTAILTELSGRIRYISFDALHEAAYDIRENSESRARMLEILTEYRSSIGAAVMAQGMLRPPVPGPRGPGVAATATEQAAALKLIRATRQHDMIDVVANFARSTSNPQLLISAAVTIRRIGLPQPPRPGSDPTLPRPAITAAELHALLSRIDASSLDESWNERRADLLAWLDVRRREGEPDATYRLGNLDVREGDWLLMRNPSPYNLFTDLSPGLFTHVGVVTTERGSDGIRRFVVVDLPERGNAIPAVPVDTFVRRTLDYVFLRHVDDEAGETMSDVARSIIGNESHFDLNFRTAGIERLKGQDLAGKKIEGYCAGLLLLCAQATERPRSDFFPVAEHPAGGNTLANLEKLGISMGHDFLSPTGALFSDKLQLVGRRETMYDPRRQIEQAVYDHFAAGLREGELTPSPDWFQSLRERLAKASKNNPLLARALADAAGVNRNMDLVAAAKLGAVIETLDEIAYGASGEYRLAMTAMRSEPARGRLRRAQNERTRQLQKYQQRHADLYQAFGRGEISPRQLRIALVGYYVAKGKRQLNERFFREPEKQGEPEKQRE
ncbi:MAG: hypothetical protein DWQ31_03900 [Planctomycetota bacterium]|nr:MAG: hypothetical protein DWQ31_03900 [Planctomycetota bacterium]REJ94114.1 MAG: hypothetical protein DWQ35_08820 [Planctomycetota bacterium]REK26300.1 MAG: hypothetical protein DWQ42_09410 [Planctomycetota bacterium]REK45851.1 MAG: hypothetical protein DWQ46_08125 [Planctomycetota bacterium]